MNTDTQLLLAEIQKLAADQAAIKQQLTEQHEFLERRFQVADSSMEKRFEEAELAVERRVLASQELVLPLPCGSECLGSELESDLACPEQHAVDAPAAEYTSTDPVNALSASAPHPIERGSEVFGLDAVPPRIPTTVTSAPATPSAAAPSADTVTPSMTEEQVAEQNAHIPVRLAYCFPAVSSHDASAADLRRLDRADLASACFEKATPLVYVADTEEDRDILLVCDMRAATLSAAAVAGPDLRAALVVPGSAILVACTATPFPSTYRELELASRASAEQQACRGRRSWFPSLIACATAGMNVAFIGAEMAPWSMTGDLPPAMAANGSHGMASSAQVVEATPPSSPTSTLPGASTQSLAMLSSISLEHASLGARQVFEELSLHADIFCSICIGFDLLSHMSMGVIQHQPWPPGPPPDELRLTSCDAELRPTPWPSFNMVERCSVRCFCGRLWKPPWCVALKVKEVEDKYIASVHSKSHIMLMQELSSKKHGASRDKIARKFNSNYFNKGSLESAVLAVGSVIEVAEKVAFALVRPPGHHAEHDEAMENILHLVIWLSDSRVMNIETTTGKKFQFQAGQSRNVKFLKNKLAAEGDEDIGNLEGHKLEYDSEELEDHQPIAEISKRHDAVVHLFIHKPAKVRTQQVDRDTLVTLVNPQEKGHLPVMSVEGSGGVYFMRDAAGLKNVVVFEPIDEKPQWPPRLDCNTKLVNFTQLYFGFCSLFCLGWVAVQYKPPWPPPQSSGTWFSEATHIIMSNWLARNQTYSEKPSHDFTLVASSEYVGASSYAALVIPSGSSLLLSVSMASCTLIQERVQRKCGGLICSQPWLPPAQDHFVRMKPFIDISTALLNQESHQPSVLQQHGSSAISHQLVSWPLPGLLHLTHAGVDLWVGLQWPSFCCSGADKESQLILTEQSLLLLELQFYHLLVADP